MVATAGVSLSWVAAVCRSGPQTALGGVHSDTTSVAGPRGVRGRRRRRFAAVVRSAEDGTVAPLVAVMSPSLGCRAALLQLGGVGAATAESLAGGWSGGGWEAGTPVGKLWGGDNSGSS